MAFIYDMSFCGLEVDVEYQVDTDDTGAKSINIIEVLIDGNDISGLFDALDVSKKADAMLIEAVEEYLKEDAKWNEVFAGADE